MTLAKTLVVLPKAIYFARAMRDDGVDHIHAHFATHATTAAWIIHRLTGIPYTFTVHAHDLFVDKHLLREKVAEAAAVVAISEFNKQILVAHCGAESAAKISVIHCGADLELFRPSVRTGIDGPFEIVCVGTLEEKKGQTHLIDACRLLRAEGVSFRCTLVGDGPRRGLLEEQTRNAGLEGAVIFTGALPRDGVAEMVSRADVVVLPSIRAKSGMMEGIPVSLMEAMACGVPVVSTRLSGIPELVGDGATGLLVEPENASALARALRKLYRSPCLRSRMGRAGRDVVLAEFDLGANANRLAMLIRSCCRQPSARTGAVCRSEPAVGTLGIEKGLGI